jgi:hypothetical protein
MSSSQRLSLKASNDVATRDAMTQRRQEWTNRIRKTKKDHILAMKRRYVPTPSTDTMGMATTVTTTESSTGSLVDLANRAVENPILHLAAFQLALSLSSNNSDDMHSSTTLKPDQLSDPLRLVNMLASILIDASSPPLRLTAARALTNLAAIDAIDAPQEGDNNYYGHVQESWSSLLVKSNILSALHQVLTTSPSEETTELLLQCCWALGNLVGDSPTARVAAMPLLPALVQTLKHGFHHKQPSLCRNAAWAVSNMARGNNNTGGQEEVFCGPNLLTPSLLASLLVSPEQQTSSSDDIISWLDVAQEVAWIVAFLTAKEDSTVNYLCLATQQQASFSSQSAVLLLEALACRVHQALQRTRQATTWSSDDATRALKMTIPCLRSIGNIASACQGKHLPALLTAHSKSIVKSLATLLELGNFPSGSTHNQLGTAAVEATWAARTLLCDAGERGHESTTIALPALLLPLCKCVTSGYGKQELKREAISALWTAAAAPPTHYATADEQQQQQQQQKSMGDVWSTRTTRDDFLRQIAHSPQMMATLVDLLRNSMDTDVVHTTLQLVNAILRRLFEDEEVRREFEEHQGVDALEHICDVASSNSHYGGGADWQDGDVVPAAEIAADLIDDLFGALEEEEMMDIVPASNGTAFTFGVVVPPVAVNTDMMMMPSRGRGRPVPSWMSNG